MHHIIVVHCCRTTIVVEWVAPTSSLVGSSSQVDEGCAEIGAPPLSVLWKVYSFYATVGIVKMSSIKVVNVALMGNNELLILSTRKQQTVQMIKFL